MNLLVQAITEKHLIASMLELLGKPEIRLFAISGEKVGRCEHTIGLAMVHAPQVRRFLQTIAKVGAQHVDRIAEEVENLSSAPSPDVVNLFAIEGCDVPGCVAGCARVDVAIISKEAIHDARAELEGGGENARPIEPGEIVPCARWLECVADNILPNIKRQAAFAIDYATTVERARLEGRDADRVAVDRYMTTKIIGQLRRANDDGMDRALDALFKPFESVTLSGEVQA